MSWSRRDILKLGAASWGIAAAPGLAPPLPVRRTRRSRYFFVILVPGGMDPIWALDPKQKNEVEPWVNVPYEADQIVDAGGLIFGPHWGPLRPHAGNLALLKGVRVNTANHWTGYTNFARLKTHANKFMPNITDLLGRYADGQPLTSVLLGSPTNLDYSSSWMPMKGTPEDEYDTAAPADLERMAAALRRQEEHLRSGAGAGTLSEREETARRYSELASFYDRLPGIPPFKPVTWPGPESEQQMALSLQRALWLFENDLTGSVFHRLEKSWDTHWQNDAIQRQNNEAFVPQLARLFQELATRKNAHGTLLSQTTLLIASEIGRHPGLNAHAGKDHLPEATFLFAGAGINTGGGKGMTFGQTDRRMCGLKVSMKTGRDVATGGESLVLDDVGTTLLDLAGLDPQVYGYFGRVLRFVEAA